MAPVLVPAGCTARLAGGSRAWTRKSWRPPAVHGRRAHREPWVNVGAALRHAMAGARPAGAQPCRPGVGAARAGAAARQSGARRSRWPARPRSSGSAAGLRRNYRSERCSCVISRRSDRRAWATCKRGLGWRVCGRISSGSGRGCAPLQTRLEWNSSICRMPRGRVRMRTLRHGSCQSSITCCSVTRIDHGLSEIFIVRGFSGAARC